MRTDAVYDRDPFKPQYAPWDLTAASLFKSYPSARRVRIVSRGGSGGAGEGQPLPGEVVFVVASGNGSTKAAQVRPHPGLVSK